MKWRPNRFNLYLCLPLLFGLISCKSAEQRKKDEEASTFMVYLETQRYDDGRNQKVEIYRANPVTLYADRTAFINTGNVVKASLEEDWGGYHIRVELDRRGALLLEGITASNVGKRMLIHCQWTEVRWLAAPKITSRIGDGIITFVPDATREESERIVRGLNNVAEKIHKQNKSLLPNIWDKD